MIKKTFLLTLLLLAFLNAEQNGVLAKIDSSFIMDYEFAQRFKKYLEATGSRDNIIVRKQVLQNMINEKLIIKDIFAKKLDNDSIASVNKKIIRNQILINEFVKNILIDSIKISDEEVAGEFKKLNTKVKVRYLYSNSFDGAMNIKKRLLDGETFEKISKEIFLDPMLAKNGGLLGYINHGEMEKSFDDIAFNLKPGELSNPVKINIGYAIIKVEDKTVINLFSQFDFEKKRDEISNKILENKIDQSLNEYSKSIAKNLNLIFNQKLVEQIFNKYFAKNNFELNKNKSNGNSVLLTSGGKQYFLKDFIFDIGFTSNRQRQKITSSEKLKEFITGMFVRESIIKESELNNISSTPNFKAEYLVAENNYYLMRWKNEVENENIKVSEIEIKKYYSENPQYSKAEINVSEILLDDINKASEITLKLSQGFNFEKLAIENSIRGWSLNKNGQLGFGAQEKYGNYFDTLNTLEKNQILGPIFVDPYFGFYKLIAKRKPHLIKYDIIKNEVKNKIIQDKISKNFIFKLNKLALNFRVIIDNDLLQTIIIN